MNSCGSILSKAKRYQNLRFGQLQGKMFDLYKLTMLMKLIKLLETQTLSTLSTY